MKFKIPVLFSVDPLTKNEKKKRDKSADKRSIKFILKHL